MNRTSKFIRLGGEKGAVAVEFALVLILLLMIVSAIVEFGRVFWYYDALTKATRDGARLMSLADKSTINSVGISAAENLVVEMANAARVSPPLTAVDNVRVECLDASYQHEDCEDGRAPANVRVSIVGFTVVIGGWIPMLLPDGGATTFTSLISPHTTMRYLQD